VIVSQPAFAKTTHRLRQMSSKYASSYPTKRRCSD
jgi:hypothetical protein